MKKAILLFLLLSQIVMAQVGIGTTNPTKDLDVNGELRVRNLPEDNDSFNILTTDNNGNISKVTDAKLLKTIFFDEATSPVNYYLYNTGNVTVDNVNLGLSITVTIPAYTKGTVIVNYSVPLGISSGYISVNGYYGIRFLRNGTEAQSGSRKYSVPLRYDGGGIDTYSMVSVSANFQEEINNSTNPNAINITYSLNGYIEQGHSEFSPVIYRFNMWSSFGDNYNWGKGYINGQLYLHQ